MPKVRLFQYVLWRSKRCIVTNAFVAGGKLISISPVGNKDSPPKYFYVSPEEVTPE